MPLKCFKCGSTSHLVKACDKPKRKSTSRKLKDRQRMTRFVLKKHKEKQEILTEQICRLQKTIGKLVNIVVNLEDEIINRANTFSTKPAFHGRNMAGTLNEVPFESTQYEDAEAFCNLPFPHQRTIIVDFVYSTFDESKYPGNLTVSKIRKKYKSEFHRTHLSAFEKQVITETFNDIYS